MQPPLRSSGTDTKRGGRRPVAVALIAIVVLAIAGGIALIRPTTADPAVSATPAGSAGVVTPPPSSPATPTAGSTSSTSPASATPPGSPIAVQCGSSLQSVLAAAPPGATVDLGTCVYTDPVDIRTPVTVLRGIIRVPGGTTAIDVNADDVTIDSTTFEGGGFTVRVHGRDRTRIIRSTFTGMTETSIDLEGPSVDDTLIEGNTIVQTIPNAKGYSPISGDGPGGTNRNLVIRGNTIDQGGEGVAWFGVEVWDNTGLIIEGNMLRGMKTLVSIPRSDGAIVRGNTFDFTAKAYWGIELSDIRDARIVDNTVIGAGASIGLDGRAFVQLEAGAGSVERITIEGNRVSDLWSLVNAAGSGHVIRDNCLNDVTKVYTYEFAGPVTIADNGPCP